MKMKILKIFDSIPNFFRKHKGFERHRRFRVFWQKGFQCVYCGIIGNTIIKWGDKRGHIHYDLFYIDKKRNRVLMTIDHIIPKSLGGTREMRNLQPACAPCNHKKADKILVPVGGF